MHLHFTSWFNQVERWFAKIERESPLVPAAWHLKYAVANRGFLVRSHRFTRMAKGRYTPAHFEPGVAKFVKVYPLSRRGKVRKRQNNL